VFRHHRIHVAPQGGDDGIAELDGCSLAERARRLIAIAAPPFREGLERAAQALNLQG